MEVISNVQTDPVRYVSDLELKSPVAEFAMARGGEEVMEMKVQEDIEQSFIADKSLVSFITNVSAQNREDVLQSTLLAQLAANKKQPIEQDIMAWYLEFAKVLSNLGWIVEGQDQSTFQTTETGVELENVIIDVLTAAFGANYITIIKKTLDAIKSLSDSDNRIVAFEKNTQALQKGCFQIGLAVVENDAVSLRLGTFFLDSDKKIKKILFVKIRKGETTLNYVSKKATFDPVAYGKIRDAVSTKVASFMTSYVSELAI